jgi:hypothetical protein
MGLKVQVGVVGTGGVGRELAVLTREEVLKPECMQDLH